MRRVTITMTPKESRVLKRLPKKLPKLTHKGLKNALIILTRQVKKNLSGPSPVRSPGNGNPFPGVLSNTLRRSVGFQLRGSDKDLMGTVGPDVDYAHFLEFGTRFMQGPGPGGGYPFLFPAFEKREKDVIDELQKAVRSSLR